MNLVFQDQYDGLIWKMLESPEDATLGLELRSEADMSVQYALIDLQSLDQLIYEHEALDWWSGLHLITPDKCYFKKFSDESDPSVFELWSISRETGELAQEQAGGLAPNHDHKSLFPVVYQEESESFQSVATFMDRKGRTIVRSVEYLELESHVCLTYYLLENKSLNRYVYVMDMDGQTLLDLQIDANMGGVVFQSFFTFGNLLIFVENRNTLHVYRF